MRSTRSSPIYPRSNRLKRTCSAPRADGLGCRPFPFGHQAAVLWHRSQALHNPSDQNPRIVGLADEIVESRNHGIPSFGCGWLSRREPDKHSLSKLRLGTHPSRDDRNRVRFSQDDDDHLVCGHYIIGRPLQHLDYSEAAPLKRLNMRHFTAGTVHDQH